MEPIGNLCNEIDMNGNRVYEHTQLNQDYALEIFKRKYRPKPESYGDRVNRLAKEYPTVAASKEQLDAAMALVDNGE